MRPHGPVPLRHTLHLLTLSGVIDTPFATLTGGVFATLFAMALGASPITIGLLAALPSLGSLMPLLVAPWLDRYSSRSTAIWMFGLARTLWLAPLALLLAPPEWPRPTLFLVVATLSAFAGATGGLAWLAWAGRLVPARLRGRYFGARGVATGTVGFLSAVAAGPLIDGRLAAHLHVGRESGLLALFAVAVGLGMAHVAALSRIETGDGRPPALGPVRVREAFTATAQGPAGRLVAFSFCWNAALNIGGPFIPVFMVERLSLSATVVAWLTALTTAAALLTARYWGRVADQHGNLAVMRGLGALAASLPAMWIVAPHLPGVPYAAFAHLVSGMIWGGFNLAAGNLALAVAPRERTAMTLAVLGAATGMGTAVGPVAGGLLLHGLEDHSKLTLGLGAYGVVFALCTVARFGALRLLRGVEEPGRRPAGPFQFRWASLAGAGRRSGEPRPAA